MILPSPVRYHYINTAGTTVIVTNNERRTTLNGFDTDNTILCVWTLVDRAVLAYSADQGQLGPFLDNIATRR